VGHEPRHGEFSISFSAGSDLLVKTPTRAKKKIVIKNQRAAIFLLSLNKK